MKQEAESDVPATGSTSRASLWLRLNSAEFVDGERPRAQLRGGDLEEAEVADAEMLRTPTGQARGPPNGRFPDSDETTGEARQNRDIECPEIPSGNHDTVNRTGDEFPDTNRC